MDCRLLVVGANPPAALFDSSVDVESVVFTGFVKELSHLYDRCRVFVAPHRFAGGVPLKVVEAMAAGIPCVVSKLLGHQLEVADGAEALVADDARDFAEKAIRLYHDAELWERVRQNAFRLVRNRYDPAKMRDLLREYVEASICRCRRT